MDADALAAVGRTQRRRRADQRLRVRVQRPREDAALVPVFHRAAQVHHHHLVGHMLHHRQVVGDEHVAGAELLLQVHEQVEDLRLDRQVQRRGRLVRDHDAGLHHHRPRDRDALALAAREHVRVALQVLRPQADLGRQRLDPLPPLGTAQRRVDHQRLRQRRRDGLARIQGGVGVLEHHLHLAPQGLARGRVGGITAVDAQRAGARRLDQRQRPRQRGLAAAGLAHHRQGLARRQFEADAVQRAHRRGRREPAAAHAVVASQVARLQHRRSACRRVRPGHRGRRHRRVVGGAHAAVSSLSG